MIFEVDLTLIGSALAASLATCGAVIWHLVVSLAEERGRRSAERAAFEFDVDAPAPLAPEEQLLAVGGYRTNPRPVPAVEHGPSVADLRAGLAASGPRADALREAVVASMFREF